MRLRHIPNALSLTRALLCIPLAILPAISGPFTIFYMALFAFACFTDTLDGQLARRIKGAKSELGATLDSVADTCMVAVIVFAIMPHMVLWGWLWIAFICVLSLKVIASTGIGLIRFKEIVSLHTISFKILVTALFLYPILYYFINAGLFFNIFSTVIICCALLVVTEEIIIISTLKKPNRNIKSIFGVKAANKAG